MSKPPPSFWLDPEGDGVEVEPPVEPADAEEGPDPDRGTEDVPDETAPDDAARAGGAERVEGA